MELEPHLPTSITFAPKHPFCVAFLSAAGLPRSPVRRTLTYGRPSECIDPTTAFVHSLPVQTTTEHPGANLETGRTRRGPRVSRSGGSITPT